MRRVLIMAVCAALLVMSSPASAADGRHVVQTGDTLTSIAKLHGVTVADLRKWNGLKGDLIRLGDGLKVRPTTKSYVIRSGDTLSAIARREGTTVGAIVKLNRGMRPNRIAVGQKLLLPKVTRKHVRQPPACPAEVLQLDKHSAYRLRNLDVAWVTAQTAFALGRGFDHLQRTHPNAPRVQVLDASRKQGGALGAHRSHRSHRDIDITYFQRSCTAKGCPVRTVRPEQLDVPRQWTLMRYWLDNDDVQVLFVDYKLQKSLYEHAKKSGVAKDKLREWFQYPRPRTARVGLIRHWDEHRNHIHVRFHELSPQAARSRCELRPVAQRR
jgi:LysM repeat protein